MAATMEPRKSRDAPSYVRTPAWRYLASLPVDRRLARYDVAGSIAHVEMLGEAGILSAADVDALVAGLRRVHAEIEAQTFPWRDDLEDVHTNVEVRLTAIAGHVGGKVHTGRSRNDQIALDERLFLRDAIHAVEAATLALQEALLDQAEAHVATVMPGYTHLQRAQPVTLAHHLLAHVWRLSRDFERLTGCFLRANVSPLGAGALAGSTLPLRPDVVARRLGFDATFDNSIDAVSDRDYLAEFLFDLALLAAHLSAIGEELVLWSSSEFGFVRPAAALGSGSSLMPQKRNPDVAELSRGKAARVLGDLTALLAVLKSLPLAYNRDLQEDKAPVFDATAHVLDTLEALAAAIRGAGFDPVRLAAAASDPRMLATDLVERLVVRGVPFREAHEEVAAFFAAAEVDESSLAAFGARSGVDVEGLLDPAAAVARRNTPGGPAPEAVREQAEAARDALGLELHTLSKHAESVRIIDAILKEERN